jgi:hypothetical protein
VGIAAAAASQESATKTTEVQTGLLELNTETFHDYIKAAGDALVVVDFFTEVSLLRWSAPTSMRMSDHVHKCQHVLGVSTVERTCR